MNTADDPVTFFGRGGVPPDQVLQDVIDIHRKVVRPKGASAHVLTGPIYVEGAAPGDMLEVRVVALEHRVPYGVNNSNRGTGMLPDLLPGPSAKIIKFDLARNVALFSDDLEVPLRPFMGIMAVAPPRDLGLVSSRPPSRWGGNMDFNKLTVGRRSICRSSTTARCLHRRFPRGAGRWRGRRDRDRSIADRDPAIHRAEGRRHLDALAARRRRVQLLCDGLDLDLNKALQEAAQETVAFLRDKKGLPAADAYALASVAVDFRIGEAVDAVQMVYGMIPKRIFKQNPDYWSKR